MNRQLYEEGGIGSLEAGAPSIKYEGDIRPEMASAPDPMADLYNQFLNYKEQGLIPKDMNFDSFKDLIRQQASSKGGIMDMVPREQALFGGIKKAVKKVTGAVKDIVSSDIGKAALLGAATFGIPGTQFGGFKFLSPIKTGIGGLFAPGAVQAGTGDVAGQGFFSKLLGKAGEALTSKTAMIGLGGAALSLLSDQGLSEEEITGLQRDPEALKGYLRSSYKRVNPTADEKQVEAFVEENTREYRADGGITSIDPDDLPMSKEGFPKYYTPEGKEISFKEFQKAMKDKKPLLPKKKPSRKNKAKGGIMDIPVRKNKAGVGELDYRKKGGFVPPIGIKEKADDIPAMLSNNEFVFTADAVRGAGGGSVNKGAQKMYKLMKQLEKRGIV